MRVPVGQSLDVEVRRQLSGVDGDKVSLFFLLLCYTPSYQASSFQFALLVSLPSYRRSAEITDSCMAPSFLPGFQGLVSGLCGKCFPVAPSPPPSFHLNVNPHHTEVLLCGWLTAVRLDSIDTETRQFLHTNDSYVNSPGHFRPCRCRMAHALDLLKAELMTETGPWALDQGMRSQGKPAQACFTMSVPEAGELFVLSTTFLIFLIKYPAGSKLTGWGDGSVCKLSATQT